MSNNYIAYSVYNYGNAWHCIQYKYRWWWCSRARGTFGAPIHLSVRRAATCHVRTLLPGRECPFMTGTTAVYFNQYNICYTLCDLPWKDIWTLLLFYLKTHSTWAFSLQVILCSHLSSCNRTNIWHPPPPSALRNTWMAPKCILKFIILYHVPL